MTNGTQAVAEGCLRQTAEMNMVQADRFTSLVKPISSMDLQQAPCKSRKDRAMRGVSEMALRCRRRLIGVGALAFLAIAAYGAAVAQEQATGLTASPPGAEVYFIGLNDGDTVSTKLTLHFGLKNMGIAPAGENRPNSGHHHLLVDTDLPPLNQPIPNDPHHLHFGAGQSEAQITLTPGDHTLQLLLGDYRHVPHSPPVMSAQIHVKAVPQGGPTPSAAGAAVYFEGLKDGATVGPKLTIHFGLKNMGVAPAGSDRPNSGHHHLLVDTDLPPMDQPIPNDPHHLHFGAGQTQATITLTPGDHTLQLLFGDKDHIPHNPPLFSDRITVHVAAPAARTPSPPGAKVYFVGLHNGDTVPQHVTIHFGLEGMGVAPAGIDKPNTGHHHLLIDTDLPPMDQPIPNDAHHLHFGAGQTEATVTLPLGKHKLQLLLGDYRHVPHDPPLMSDPITVNVVGDTR
jgi:hypothetical protein